MPRTSGRLIARYLEKHPERSKVKYAIAGRSVNKLSALANELKLDHSNVAIIGVNISVFEELEALVRRTRLIINCVGPFALYSTPVVRYVHTRHRNCSIQLPLQRVCADCNSLYRHHRRSTLDPQDDSRVFPNVRSPRRTIHDSLSRYDYLAAKNKAIIIPASGMDSVPRCVGALVPTHN